MTFLGGLAAGALYVSLGGEAARGALLGCCAGILAFRLHVVQVTSTPASLRTTRMPWWILARGTVCAAALVAAVSTPRISLAATIPFLFLPQVVLVFQAAIAVQRPQPDG